ncbi:MAG: acyltransferase [Bacteroidaceae bacterium]|nr:acyltransferase [Bacteroidaceae bacterium]
MLINIKNGVGEIHSSNDYSIEKLQSDAIDFLRFPLAIAVIFIHSGIPVTNFIDFEGSLFSMSGLLNLLGIVFSHVLTHIAVPVFFLISGFLFFYNFKNFSWNGYKSKLKSRFYTLFIPYLLWNILPWLLALTLLLLKSFLKEDSFVHLFSFLESNNWNIFYNSTHWGADRINWLGENLGMWGPYNLPLWYLRDLIFMTILTPVIYAAIKYLKWGALFYLILAYVSRIWFIIPGLHITAFLFFSLGAYFSLNNLNIIEFVRRYKFFIIPISIILFIATVIYDGTNTVIGQNIYPFFIISATFAAFYFSAKIIQTYKIKPNKFLVSSYFFIYACHTVSFPIFGDPVGRSKYIIHKIIPGNSIAEDIVTYLLTPFLVALICVVLLQICKRYMPNVIKYFIGSR